MINITKEELDDFMKQIEGIKSTIDILQNKELMKDIKDGESFEKKEIELFNINIQ